MKDQPYFWTMSLTGEDYAGEGVHADVALRLDESSLYVSVNGRDFDAAPYLADPNDETQTVRTEGLYCPDGRLGAIRYEDGYDHDRQLFVELLRDDGRTETVVFHSGSEDLLYVSTEGGAPVFADPRR
jgi:hypothetical protein